jgi:hypothetical protein
MLRRTRVPAGPFLIVSCRGAMVIATPFGAHRPAVSSSFACPAGARRPTPVPFADLRDGPSGCFSNQHGQQRLRMKASRPDRMPVDGPGLRKKPGA